MPWPRRKRGWDMARTKAPSSNGWRHWRRPRTRQRLLSRPIPAAPHSAPPQSIGEIVAIAPRANRAFDQHALQRGDVEMARRSIVRSFIRLIDVTRDLLAGLGEPPS